MRRSAAIDELVEAAHASGLVLPAAALARFETYLETLLLWRRRLSLTGASTALAIVREHVADAFFVAPLIRPGFRVADLGSGAGFPGVPLAIVCPEATVVLVEARRKKANFLREVVRQTNLDNVEVAEERAESLTDHVGSYDLIVSRAVWPLEEFLRVGEPLLRRGGLLTAMKGPKGLAESLPHKHPGFSQPEVIYYQLHGGVRRVLLVYRRLGPAASEGSAGPSAEGFGPQAGPLPARTPEASGGRVGSR